MKYFLIILVFTFFTIGIPFADAGFDDILKDVLVETQNQVIGGSDYVFAPGDPIIKQDTYVVYYSGSESSGSSRTLLLTLVSSSGNILLKYPSPDVIGVRGYKLQVLEFDNSGFKVRVLQKG